MVMRTHLSIESNGSTDCLALRQFAIPVPARSPEVPIQLSVVSISFVLHVQFAMIQANHRGLFELLQGHRDHVRYAASKDHNPLEGLR